MTTRSSSTAAKLPTANDIKLINDAHQAVVTSSQSGLEHAIECGEMLKTAKEKVGHGGWENWLADMGFELDRVIDQLKTQGRIQYATHAPRTGGPTATGWKWIEEE